MATEKQGASSSDLSRDEFTNERIWTAADVSGFVAGEPIEVTPENHDVGELMFGDHWPAVRERLLDWMTIPTAYTVTVTSISGVHLPNLRKHRRRRVIARRMRG